MAPQITAHFEDIHKVLLSYIESAEISIIAAVAWFTDRDIYAALRKKAALGVSVKVAITDDEINTPPKAPAFDALIDLGGEIHRITPESKNASLMHHKFCVIDNSIVITGSYNWTLRARQNAENITVVSNHPLYIAQFVDTFEQIIGNHAQTEQSIDTNRIRKRLELIRNLIQLDEIDDIFLHTHKLRSITDLMNISKILAALDKGEYKGALEEIEKFIIRTSSLVVTEDFEVPYLRLQLQTLELELTALSAEHVDLERRLVLFNRRHDEALGEFIQAYLLAKAELARLHAIKARMENPELADDADEKAQFAEDQYQDYSKNHQQIKNSPPPKKLDGESEKTLKKLYKQASQLCHPDKVEEEYKAKATELFQELQEAYRSQDLDSVESILGELKKGEWAIHSRSSVLTESSRLYGAIAELKHQISNTLISLRELKASPGVNLMESFQNNKDGWTTYVERRIEELKAETSILKNEISRLSPKN